MSTKTLFDYNTLAFDLSYRVVLLEEILVFMFHFIRPSNPPSLEIHIKQQKHLSPSQKICAKLFCEYKEILYSLDILKILKYFLLFTFVQSIQSHPPKKNIILLEFFASIDIGLVVRLEARLINQWYIYVDIETAFNQAV